MALTTLDQKTALIVIDLQRGVVSLPAVHPMDEVVGRSVTLAEAFRAHGLPVVLVTVGGAPAGRTERSTGGGAAFPDGWDELVAELNQQASDHTVKKFTRGAFTNTGLDEHLKGIGVTQVVISGVATSSGVESTARHAHELGFNVTLAVDAMTDMNEDAHNNSVTRIFPGLGETGTTAEILELLAVTRA
jgi:nicotinamidase-related amidase